MSNVFLFSVWHYHTAYNQLGANFESSMWGTESSLKMLRCSVCKSEFTGSMPYSAVCLQGRTAANRICPADRLHFLQPQSHYPCMVARLEGKPSLGMQTTFHAPSCNMRHVTLGHCGGWTVSGIWAFRSSALEDTWHGQNMAESTTLALAAKGLPVLCKGSGLHQAVLFQHKQQ